MARCAQGCLPWAAVLTAMLAACGGAQAPTPRADRPLPVPNDELARRLAVDVFGQRIFAALNSGDARALLVDDLSLRALLSPEVSSRVAASRAALGARISVPPRGFQSLHGTAFGGLCLQGARVEPAGGPLGLVADGWVAERALMMAAQAGGSTTRRLGAWVEGLFVFTSDGFDALDLARIEPPRWEHSDLELAPCDVEVGIRSARPVVVVTE